MAFNRTDTDGLYDGLIAPMLASKDVDLRRVDRIVHIDNVDDKIVTEIKDADFVIADLTYARPSVYFEAGFAERAGTSVIYTCRQDHLGAAHDKQHDYLRVHFDLSVRNIITWRHATDRRFRRALEQRVDFVRQPLLAESRRAARTEADRRAFQSLSLNQKEGTIQRICEALLRSRRYHRHTLSPEQREIKFPVTDPTLASVIGKFSRTALPASHRHRVWLKSGHHRTTCVYLGIEGPRADGDYHIDMSFADGLSDQLKELDVLIRGDVRELVAVYFVLALRRGALASIGEALPGACFDPARGAHVWESSAELAAPQGGKTEVPRLIRLHALDDIQSEAEFRQFVSDALSLYD